MRSVLDGNSWLKTVRPDTKAISSNRPVNQACQIESLALPNPISPTNLQQVNKTIESVFVNQSTN